MDWRRLCHDLLRVTIGDRDIDGQRLHLNWLLERFSILALDVDDESVRCYCRAIIMQLIGGFLFADKSNSKVHFIFLPLLKDFEASGSYSWGNACLAWLYIELCRASHTDAYDISGLLIILQLWIWEISTHCTPTTISLPCDRRLPPPLLDIWYI